MLHSHRRFFFARGEVFGLEAAAVQRAGKRQEQQCSSAQAIETAAAAREEAEEALAAARSETQRARVEDLERQRPASPEGRAVAERIADTVVSSSARCFLFCESGLGLFRVEHGSGSMTG